MCLCVWGGRCLRSCTITQSVILTLHTTISLGKIQNHSLLFDTPCGIVGSFCDMAVSATLTVRWTQSAVQKLNSATNLLELGLHSKHFYTFVDL